MHDHDRIRWARSLVVAGWSSSLAYTTYLVTQVRRAAAIGEASFEDGVWGQRIEQVSFAALPQNLIILVPGAAAAVAGAIVVRSLVDPVVVRLGRLVRVVASLASIAAAISTIGIVAVFFRNYDNVGDTAAILGRLGGIALAWGMIRVCLDATQET
ncbi:MAG: hypothetical protein RLZZ01_822 [Actinomycetota bacterium]